MSSLVKVLYSSPNGDTWSLYREDSGKLLVSHNPSSASGRMASYIEANEFIARGGQGPEWLALLETLESLGGEADPWAGKTELPVELIDRLCCALGRAVGRRWSRLPQDVQQELFEAAVGSEGEGIRQPLAVFLHGKHARTMDAIHSRAMPEPDSLGG